MSFNIDEIRLLAYFHLSMFSKRIYISICI